LGIIIWSYYTKKHKEILMESLFFKVKFEDEEAVALMICVGKAELLTQKTTGT